MTLLSYISAIIIFLLLAKPLTEFVVDYFRDLTVRRVIGGLLFFAGAWFISLGQKTGDMDKLVAFGVAGLVVGGVGAIIVHYDISKQRNFSEMDVLAKALGDKDKKQ